MDEKLLESAKNYYILALINMFNGLSDDYRSQDTVLKQFQKKYIGSDDYNDDVHTAIFLLAARTLVDHSLLDVITSEFSQPYIRKSSNFSNSQSLSEFEDLFGKYRLLGSSGDAWLRSTFSTIGQKFDSNEVWEYLKKWLRDRELPDTPSQPETIDTSEYDDDEWQPIKIERDTETYKEAVDASEAAVREIEASNGYAATNLEERNAIVASVKGTLDAIKNGAPSKQSIRYGLLSPLKFIARKFAETTIGEIAKLALVKLAAWLAGL